MGTERFKYIGWVVYPPDCVAAWELWLAAAAHITRVYHTTLHITGSGKDHDSKYAFY